MCGMEWVDQAADVHPLVVPCHDPVISPQIVLGVWCNSPAEPFELCLDRGLGGCPYGVVGRGLHGSVRRISPMSVG